MRLSRWLPIQALMLGLAAEAGADQVVIAPARDNTLYETVDGAYSNGAGENIFAGKTNGGLDRRAVMYFDVAAAVPAGSTITSVSLTLHMSRTSSGTQTLNLYRLTSSWGEGASVSPGTGGSGGDSQPGDATWIHRFYPTTLWGTPGGDRAATSSGSRSVSGIAFYTWTSTPQMVADVQGWLNTPLQNFGWVLIGNEGPNHTTKRFDSRENSVAANRPALTITYTPPAPPCAVDWNHNGTLEPADVASFVNDWFASLTGGTLAGDFDHNGTVAPADVAVFVSTWSQALQSGC